ncbi:MlaD family protein [Mycolicibacterium sp.]|jgi:virulence factor Mce-like protein|uniref:MlaD family protein n=1 Tax=Mycolicibacterium sp. TaxID=2320850 RepID=UPI0028AD8525|nr:MlaD family protein [Mycolicibacterium sp.]
MVERKYKNTPRKRVLEDRSRTSIGLVALVVLAALMATMVVITKVGPGYKRISADFIQAAALLPKNPVVVAGIPVGTVTGLRLNGDKVTVDMKVQNNLNLGKDSRATIMVTTILGSRYMSLTPGGGGPLENNNIDINHTSVPYDLQEALQDVAINYGEVNTDQLAAAVEALGRQVQDMPPLVPKAMDNLKRLSTVISDRRDQFGNMLKTMDYVTGTLRRQQTSIGGMVNQGNELLGEFVARQAAFSQMLQGLTDLVNVLDDTIVTDRAEVDSLLANMNILAGLANKHNDLMAGILESAPLALRGLANMTGTGNALDAHFPNGLLVDSWMCAISGRAQQFELNPYYKDCK